MHITSSAFHVIVTALITVLVRSTEFALEAANIYATHHEQYNSRIHLSRRSPDLF